MAGVALFCETKNPRFCDGQQNKFLARIHISQRPLWADDPVSVNLRFDNAQWRKVEQIYHKDLLFLWTWDLAPSYKRVKRHWNNGIRPSTSYRVGYVKKAKVYIKFISGWDKWISLLPHRFPFGDELGCFDQFLIVKVPIWSRFHSKLGPHFDKIRSPS